METITKCCSKCGEEKPLDAFFTHKKCKYGVRPDCKECYKVTTRKWNQNNPEKRSAYDRKYYRNNKATRLASVMKRRIAKINRTPDWADLDEIREVYKNCPNGYEVDHIYPLQGKTVSGLHVSWNLQYLTPAQNRAKGNKLV